MISPPKSGNWFEQLFHISPDPTWIIEQNRFVECNEAAIHTLGYGDRHELLNVHPSRLSPPVQPDGEDSFAKAERMIALAEANGLHRFEWIHARSDGTPFTAEVTLAAIELHGRRVLYCVWRDISERKANEGQLQLAANIINGTHEGILVTDHQGIIQAVNPAFSIITGYDANEAVGRGANLLKSDHHDEAFYRELWQAVATTGHWEGEIWNRRKNGEVYPEWLNISTLPAQGTTPARHVAIFHDITENHKSAERIRHLAFHDVLTGLPNRTLFQDRLEHALERAKREGNRLAVMFMDLDGFKAVNDSLGHDIGDLLLQEVATRMRLRLRRGADTVARLGGDEFVVLMENLKDPEHCAFQAECILEDILKPMEIRDHNVQVGASMGMAFYPEDGNEALHLMKCADAAMYSAKASGKGTYRFFQPEMLASISTRLSLETELRQAIVQRQLVLHYQPKVCMSDQRLTGVEALVRWPHPTRGMIMPGDFIPIAEETGLIVPLGNWVLEEACRQAAAWIADGLQITIAINISARQITKGRLPESVTALLAQYRIPATALQIEITESAFMADPDAAIAVLDQLRSIGLSIAVDDFGTGYSSLARLSGMPIDMVKIDRSFVLNAEHSHKDVQVVRTVIALAEALGLDVVAEGVESVGQATLLKDSGCDICQGYYFAHPQAAEQLTDWIKSRACN
jgi:diguanylate cyclase (GGDEF)-like protein/PAS domain S-box-containing protein